MPTSRSLKPNADRAATPPRVRVVGPLIGIAVAAVLAVVASALPASLIRRVLPGGVGASDFSGSIWHGSAAHLVIDGHEAGALEWQVHPGALLTLTVVADLHWVKIGLVADGVATLDRHGLTLRHLEGGGPVEDLRDLGVAAGWHGTSTFDVDRLRMAFDHGGAALQSVVGRLAVADLAGPQVAAGADLGGYTLTLSAPVITPGVGATAELSDTGTGPLEVKASLHVSLEDRTGMLSGTVKERSDAPAALRRQIADLAQLHARDGQGRIPVDLEFTF